MKILIINYEYPPLGGGGATAARDQAVELSKRHEVHVLTSGGFELAEDEVVDGVRVFRAPVWGRNARSTASFLSMVTFWPIGTKFGKKLIAEHKYDIICTWFAVPSGPTGVHLSKAAGCPHVLCLAGGDVYDPSKWYTPDKNPLLAQVVKWVLRNTDARAALSTDLSRRTRQIYGFEGDIDVIPLGAVPNEVEVPDRQALGMTEEGVYMVSVGRLVRRKNLARLLNAMGQIDDNRLNMLILGDGPEKENLAQQAQRLGIADRVYLKGFVSELEKQQYLRAADIFTLPSLHEGFGIVYIEAMQAGLPVIAGRPGGHEDFLAHGETGFLIPYEDTDGIRDAIKTLLDDPERRRQMGQESLNRGRSFTPETTALKFERLFERVLASRR